MGKRVAVAAVVLVRQPPGTASGVLFMTIEDETGAANLILSPKVYKHFRRAARHSVAVIASGKVERQGAVVHVVMRRIADIRDYTDPSALADSQSRDFH